jgi:hypothetical protein
LIILQSYSNAHNPRIIRDKKNNSHNPIVIENPEISQAFYWELKSKSDFFTINSPKEFVLYVSLLIPLISWAKQEYGFIIKDNKENIIGISDINEYKSEIFHEKFAGDFYYQWPKFKNLASSGSYTIQIYSPDNRGKYVLAIGEWEKRSLYEIYNTFKSLPIIKSYFFNQHPITMFLNYIWLSILVLMLGIFLIIIAIYKLYQKKFKS